MFVAIFDSGSFHWHAAGNTREEALEALGAGWAQHVEETGAAWSVEDVLEDANVIDLRPGEVMRDYSPYLLEPEADMPSPVADLLSRFRDAAADVQALYAEAEDTDPVQDNAYERAHEAAGELTENYLYPLADALGDVIGEQR